jgi:hypothetical protein
MKKIKMIALSIGGNDFGFGSVVKKCVLLYAVADCSGKKAVKENFEAGAVATIQPKIKKGIENIGEALTKAGYKKTEFTILVQDYPSPIPANAAEFRYAGASRIDPGRCEFRNNDANWANETALKTINETVKKAAEEAGANYTVKIMELESAFNGRRLCETGLKLIGNRLTEVPSWGFPEAVDETEWFNQIRVRTVVTPFAVQEDLHPDYWGQLALRNCLRQAYNKGVPKAGTCVIGGAGRFAVPGTPFEWPSEPWMKLEP